MTTIHYVCLLIGLIAGASFTLLAMCLVAMGKLGDDPLPEIEPQRIPLYQD